MVPHPSTGEEQRLGIARLLINRRRLVFLDEATSAVDAGLEHALYTLIRTHLPDCTLVSVGHHSSLTAVHTHTLHLLGQGRWDLMAPISQRNGQRRVNSVPTAVEDHVLR